MVLPGFIQNRASLLTIIALITTFSALGPFFLEEVTCTIDVTGVVDEHGHANPDETGCLELVAHETLHIAAITFGIFLVIVSFLAYISTRNTNMIWTMFAFLTFTLLSVFLLVEDMSADRLDHDEAIIVDVLLTVMIGFFAIGVFSNQRFPTRTKYN